MGRLARFTQLLFGNTATGSRIAVFGSLAQGSPTAYSGATVSPDLVQQESAAFATGWDGALIGNNSPAVQDSNALDYLWGYQLSYLFQQGIPEYDGSTQYYSNSIVQLASTGVVYQAIGSPLIGTAPPSSPWLILSNSTAPAVTVLLSGSGSYSVPANAKYLKIKMIGGGGGGAANVNAGSDGSVTTFGSSFLVCSGGHGGNGLDGGFGGSATATGGNFTGIVLQGGAGASTSSAQLDSAECGGCGASSPFGGSGRGGKAADTGHAAVANTGAGGGGTGEPEGYNPGGGGGAGGYIEGIITTPLTSYTYNIGDGGAGGAGSGPTSGYNGGNGGSGQIYIEAHFS